MLLSFVAFAEGTQDYAKLCLIPKEESAYARPVNIDLLFQTNCAVFHIGPKEAVTVELIEDGNTKVIRPVPPSVVYLTPDNPDLPGIRAMMIKVHYPEDGLYSVSYRKDLEQGWKDWNPIEQVR